MKISPFLLTGLALFSFSTTVVHAASDAKNPSDQIYPATLDWPDRRPIGAVFMAISDKHWPGNPRGYFGDATLDVATDAGKARLHELLMKKADDAIAATKKAGGQGVIVWDIEGDQMPHAITYLGDPRVLPEEAPEMDAMADEFFKKFTDAGLKTGICIRPSKVIPDTVKGGWKHRQVDDHVTELADKIAYAKKRWGCTIFYMDTNVKWPMHHPEDHPGDKSWGMWQGDAKFLTPEDMRDLHQRQPDVLICPEFQSPGYFASVSGYKEYFKVGDFSADVRKIYPKAFRIWMPRIMAMDVYEHWDDFVTKGIMYGEVFLFEADPSNPFAQLLQNAQADAAMRAKPGNFRQAKDAPSLLEQLRTATDWPARRMIIEALSRFPDATVTATLDDILKNDTTGLDIFAAMSLGKQGTHAALQALAADLTTGKATAAIGLGASGKSEAAGPLTALLTNSSKPELRWAALDALGELKRPETVPPLIDFLKTSSASGGSSRLKTISALGMIGDRRAAAPLIDLLGNTEYNTMHKQIFEALVKVTGYDGGKSGANNVKTWQDWQKSNP